MKSSDVEFDILFCVCVKILYQNINTWVKNAFDIQSPNKDITYLSHIAILISNIDVKNFSKKI